MLKNPVILQGQIRLSFPPPCILSHSYIALLTPDRDRNGRFLSNRYSKLPVGGALNLPRVLVASPADQLPVRQPLAE